MNRIFQTGVELAVNVNAHSTFLPDETKLIKFPGSQQFIASKGMHLESRCGSALKKDQRWRWLPHWTAAINQVGDVDAIAEALSKVKAELGKSLEEAIKEACDKIPAGQPLRALIRAQGGQ